ncbi:MAG: ubiquinol oxidase subunit II [Burkholderiales bacterium]|nr:ubiquinol oxidase subunit II [Burkholderiales bacterium]MDE2452809.1 ubiquinol oxidase subunit II [Burkholderiales bacterium]MDE3010019.1 ubiquinol oxidase subunit II [Pseudomonadota bacterium]
MHRTRTSRRLASLLLLTLPVFMTGCDTVVIKPSGDIAAQQGHLVVVSTVLMLLIIVPVILLTLFFAWRYRQSNKSAAYDPEWDHSTTLELVIWTAPLLIIIALGAITWISTHTLDPYRRLDRIDAARPLPADSRPLVVDVVALDWKWLFIYPEQGIATVNELAAPVDRPIHFNITASSVMNSFYIPALAGQIYAMPGMQTQLNAVINKAGNYQGFSANYSGAGFSDMNFQFRGLSEADFEHWVQSAKSGSARLDDAAYKDLVQPSVRVPVQRFGDVQAELFDRIVGGCFGAGAMCMNAMGH